MLLVDPVCVSERGHNLPLLLDYQAFVGQVLGAQVQVHGSLLLPEHVSARTGVERTFPFAYGHVSQLMTNLHLQPGRGADQRNTAVALRESFTRLLGMSTGPVSVVFPYADYLGVLACAAALESVQDPGRVTLCLRFIGVMETAAPPGKSPFADLADAVAMMRRRGVVVALAAESAPYAAELSAVMGEIVDLAPPPAPAWARSTALHGTDGGHNPVAYCPGSGRGDKGFTSLPEIVRRYRVAYPESLLEFVCQEPAPSLDPLLHQTRIRLQALPGVEVLPSMISLDDMARQYAASAFVLLPYDRLTYRVRSSASLADAVAACAPVVTFTGTGLESYVAHYGLGKTAADLDSLVDACHDLSLEDPHDWRRRTSAALWRYDRDVESSWRRWIRGEAR